MIILKLCFKLVCIRNKTLITNMDDKQISTIVSIKNIYKSSNMILPLHLLYYDCYTLQLPDSNQFLVLWELDNAMACVEFIQHYLEWNQKSCIELPFVQMFNLSKSFGWLLVLLLIASPRSTQIFSFCQLSSYLSIISNLAWTSILDKGSPETTLTPTVTLKCAIMVN